MSQIEYELNTDLKDLFIRLLSAKISKDDINNLYVESDFDTYIKIYGNDNIIKRLKMISYLDEDIKQLLYSYKYIDNVKLNLYVDKEILITFARKYLNLVVLPEDTLINILYTEVYYDEEHSYVKNIELLNTEVTQKQKSLLKMNNLNNTDLTKLEYYDKIIDDIIDNIDNKNRSDIVLLQNEHNKYVIKYDNYVLKMYSPGHLVDEYDDHINEAFIGLFGTNKLREKIPNFALIYDILFDKKCPTIYNNDPDAIYLFEAKYCSYILYEYIEGITLRQFILEANLEIGLNMLEVLKVIIKQIIFSLYEANILIDFTDYDLHDQNIIIKELPEEITIIYPNSGQKVITKYLVVIIDYGSSHIKYNGINYGKIFPEGNINNESFWMHDIFKILMFLYKNTIDRIIIYKDIMEKHTTSDRINNAMHKMIITSDTLKEYIVNLLSFFTGENMTDNIFSIYTESNPYYAIRQMNKFNNEKFSFDNFISFVKNL